MLFALLVQLNRNIVFEFEMNEAISKPLCDDVIVSNDKIEEDDVENENESIELDKKKKRLGSQQLNVGNFIQGLVWVRMEKKRQNVMLVAKKKNM